MTDKSKRIAAFLAYALITYAMGFLLRDTYTDVGYFLSLTVTPVCLGAIAQVLFDGKVEAKFYIVWQWAILLTVIMLLVLALFRLETTICIAMSLPIIVLIHPIGIWAARAVLRDTDKHNKTYSALFLLPLFVLPFEGLIKYPLSKEVVRSEIIINAPADVVWQHTVAIPAIKPDERIWTVSHNLLGTPRPISAALDGTVRSLQWSKGVLFRENVTESVVNERLAWTFDFHAPETLRAFDPHISPNSRMLRVTDGFYELTKTADGQTLLVLETRYQIRTPLNAYVRLWGQGFLTDFHDSVLAVIKQRAEFQG